MARGRRGRATDELNPWPGYVDALSTLLMVIIFVLLVFVLAQAFLSVALTSRDRALDRLNRQVAELSDMLSLERGRATELQASVASLGRDAAAAAAARDAAAAEQARQRNETAGLLTERNGLRMERDQLAARLADAELQAGSAAVRLQGAQARLAETVGATDTASQEAAELAGQLAQARRQLAGMRAEQEAIKRTSTADREIIQTKLADIARLTDQVRQLAALRAQLERQAQDAAVRATTDEQRRQALAIQLSQEQKLSESSRAQVAALSQQIEQLRSQMAAISASLAMAEAGERDKDTQIAGLSGRLNLALAARVEELQRYRSEFFGRLRDVLANRPGIQVVGDRFVFQSEVLFPAGSADLTTAGQEQLRALAGTLKNLAQEIPRDVRWIMRVDGHADRAPIRGAAPGNWELSAQRAINVVRLLTEEGVPASRLAATGFGEFQPLDPAETPAAFARNRRIEIRLTDR